MAELAYLQVSRVCNQACRFCSNPANGRMIPFKKAARLVDHYVQKGYAGLILTGGEPTLCPDLADIIRYASRKMLPTRLITNGQKTADPAYLDGLLDAGLGHVHVSIYSQRPEVHDFLTQKPGSLERASRTLELLGRSGATVNVNTVINKRNADHLSAVVRWLVERFPHVRHVVYNNLDPLMSPPATVGDCIPRFKDFELELLRALAALTKAGKTFRVERVPLCYLAGFEHVSTETRKIVKNERRAVYFLDEKGLYVQKKKFWQYGKPSRCRACTLEAICAGVYQMDKYYSAGEACPVFVSRKEVVSRIRHD